MDKQDLAARCWIGLPGTELDEELIDLLTRFTPGGVVLFSRNLTPEASQIRGLIGRLQEIARRSLGKPMAIAIDQEGGTVRRLPPPFGQYPDASSYGPEGEEAVFRWGLDQGRELAGLGLTMNLAPVLDINTLGQEGVMSRRAWGTDPETVTRLGLAAIRGLRAGGVAACAKHFPGIGHSSLDSHLARPIYERSLGEMEVCELLPFQAAVAEGVEAIMVSHLLYPALDPDRPASLSEAVMKGLLREKMGFEGLILSDDLQMGAITKELDPKEAALAALEAGADRVLICQGLEPFRRLVGA